MYAPAETADSKFLTLMELGRCPTKRDTTPKVL